LANVDARPEDDAVRVVMLNAVYAMIAVIAMTKAAIAGGCLGHERGREQQAEQCDKGFGTQRHGHPFL
jgi:hypothetical protein